MYENDEIENLENKQPGPYNSMKSSNWVQSFLKNNRYKFIRVPGDGDCLFTTLKLGYESIGINLPVSKMREMVSNDTNQEQFDSYNEFYTLYKFFNLELDRDNFYKELVAIELEDNSN